MPPPVKRLVVMPSPKVRSTGAQLRYMIDFMSKNPDLASRKTPLTPYHIGLHEAKWYKLRQGLRGYGRDKSVRKWKITWRDLVRSAKAEKLRCNQQQKEISSQALSVLEIIDKAEDPVNKGIDEIHNSMAPIDNGMEISKEGSDFEGVIEALDDSLDENSDAAQDTINLTLEDSRLKRFKSEPLLSEDTEENGEHHATETVNVLSFPEITENPLHIPKKVYRCRRRSNSSDSYTMENKTKSKNKHISNTSKSDSAVLDTLNRFIEYENEKERLAHEKEINRMKQNEKALDLLGRMVRVIEDLAPSIKKCLNRDVTEEFLM